MPSSNSGDDELAVDAPLRADRRAARRARIARAGRDRRLTVRSELRDQPDVRKIARAVIAMAMAEAEREAQAQAAGDSQEPGDE